MALPNSLAPLPGKPQEEKTRAYDYVKVTAKFSPNKPDAGTPPAEDGTPGRPAVLASTFEDISIGFTVAFNDEKKLEVMSVTEESEAEKQGVKVGQELIEVEASNLTYEPFEVFRSLSH